MQTNEDHKGPNGKRNLKYLSSPLHRQQICMMLIASQSPHIFR